MTVVQGFFEKLHFLDCHFGKPIIDGRMLTIPVSGLLLLAGHPLSESQIGPLTGQLVFRDVNRTCLVVIEYIGDPRNPAGFKEPKTTETGPVEQGNSYDEFSMEGYQEEPPAWIDVWTIEARSFELLVSEDK